MPTTLLLLQPTDETGIASLRTAPTNPGRLGGAAAAWIPGDMGPDRSE